MTWNPNDDGITHINIYSKGNTKLGRFLTHFARTPFQHPVYGNFESVEGLWYFLKTGMKDNYLKSLFGYAAKEHGKKLAVVPLENFDQLINEANRIKLDTYPEIRKAIKESSIPFTHYYVFGDFNWDKGKRLWAENSVIRESKGGKVLVSFWESIRTELQMEDS